MTISDRPRGGPVAAQKARQEMFVMPLDGVNSLTPMLALDGFEASSCRWQSGLLKLVPALPYNNFSRVLRYSIGAVQQIPSVCKWLARGLVEFLSAVA